jgi:putative addiction module component (TIGR02574 family)
MVDPTLLIQIRQLPVADRLEVISELWGSLDFDNLPVSEAEKTLLDERLADQEAHPEASLPWTTLKQDLAAKLR